MMSGHVEDSELASHMYLAVLAPLQTSHAAPTDSLSTPVPVAFELHDYECLVDWDYLAQLVAKHGSVTSGATQAYVDIVNRQSGSSSSNNKRIRNESTDNDAATQANKHAKVNHDHAPKGKATEQSEPKLPYPLASTSLLFRLSPHGRDNEGAVAALISLVSSSRTSLTLTQCSLEPCSINAKEVQGQLSIADLNLRSKQGDVHIATLPIVSLINAPLERNSHTWTNGVWLLSAVKLAQLNVIDLQVELSVRSVSTREQLAYGISSGSSVTLEVKLTMSLLRSAFAASSNLARADHLMQLMRFISPSAEREATRQTCTGSRVSADFIYAHMTSSKLTALPSLQPYQLTPTLLPFQRRSLNFLLGREGFQLAQPDAMQSRKALPPLIPVNAVQSTNGLEKLGLWWEQVGIREELYFDALSACFSTDLKVSGANVQAAILAEEMGLGKTVEVLALVLLNPAPQDVIDNPQPYYDKSLELEILPAKTSLIVCPEILRQQWLDEAAAHAAELKVYSFLSRKRAEQDKPDDKGWAEWAASFDVIVVSFGTLRTELHVAQPERARSRRFDRKYERPRSPLLQLRYHRVIMDEVQLVGHSGVADIVSMIERTSSIAVSGTPIKRGNLTDLQSLFRFLRVPFVAGRAHWQRMLGPSMAHSLARVLRVLATRHLKQDVKNEMELPTQTRWLVPIELGPVQRAYYDDMWNAALEDLGLNEQGEPATEMYEPDIEKLRRHLLLLRRCCTHPQVAQAVNPVGGAGARRQHHLVSKTIQDMKSVVERMIVAASATCDSLYTTIKSKAINSAILLLQDKSNPDPTRLEQVRTLLQRERNQLESKIKELKQSIKDAEVEGPAYRFSEEELAELARLGEDSKTEDSDEEDSDSGEADASVAAGELTLQEKVKLRANYVLNLKHRLRLFLEQFHRALHTLGSVFYQLGVRDLQCAAEAQAAQTAGAGASAETNGAADAMDVDEATTTSKEAVAVATSSDATTGAAQVPAASPVSPYKVEEDVAYAAAELIRHELLEDRLKDTERTATSVRKLKEFDIAEAESFDAGGLQSHEEFSRLRTLSELLDANAKVIKDWRSQIRERILKPVNREVDQSNENDDQYAEALDDQAEAETLVEMYRVLLVERERILTGHTGLQATVNPRLFTAVEQQVDAAKRAAIMGAEDHDANPALVPQAEQLQAMTLQLDHFRRLDWERYQVSLNYEYGGLVDVIPLLRAKADRTERREEIALAYAAADQVRGMIKKQKTSLEALNREQVVFTYLFNARSAYFRQMQVISDSVRDLLVNESIAVDRENLATDMKALLLRHGEAQTRVKWLTELKKDESIDCEICAGEYPVQCAMPCGHHLCEGCVLKLKSCPRCFKPIHVPGVPLQLISVVSTRRSASPGDEDDGEGTDANASSPARVHYIKPTYNLLSDKDRSQLQAVHIEARYGSKLHLLTQHLVHIQNTEPSSKTIVFSSFCNGLDLVSQALNVQCVPHVRVDVGGKAGGQAVIQFRDEDKDSGVNVLLLHSEAQSAGLNLLCATRIILLEPLVNHVAELQALGRIHRIGQTHETHVYCYSATNTVEERICNAQAARGQSLFLLGKASSAISSDSSTLPAPIRVETDKTSLALRRQGERVHTLPELLACFFDAHTAKQAVVEPMPQSQHDNQRQQAQQAEGSNAAEQRRAFAAAAADERRRQAHLPVLT